MPTLAYMPSVTGWLRGIVQGDGQGDHLPGLNGHHWDGYAVVTSEQGVPCLLKLGTCAAPLPNDVRGAVYVLAPSADAFDLYMETAPNIAPHKYSYLEPNQSLLGIHFTGPHTLKVLEGAVSKCSLEFIGSLRARGAKDV